MKYILTLLMLLVLPMAAIAADVTYDSQERVINLPDDAGQWYVTLFGDATNPDFAKIQQWLQTNPKLSHLVDQCHYNEYSTGDVRFKARYAANMPGLPCLRIQNSRGQVVSEWWGQYIPATSYALFDGIRDDLLNPELFNRRCCPLRRCPRPPVKPPVKPPVQPPVQPPVKPPVKPPVDKPPAIEPPSKPQPTPVKSKMPPWWAMLAAVVAGAGVGVVQEWKKEYFPES